MPKIGLRIDVDTFRGMRDGVPALCELLAEHDIKATFFFSVGPDNMGRNLWRLLRPDFLVKMMRTNAVGLYGWDIIFRGTFWPGPKIGRKLDAQIKAAADAGHEIGFHAWDHYRWQTCIDKQSVEEICWYMRRGVEQIRHITGSKPVCAAAPSWKCSERVLQARDQFKFRFNSDCRGTSIFYPVVNGKTLRQPQIPTTLPTYDEVMGQGGITDENYNDYILSKIKEDQLNILTIHAEVEGIAAHELFRDFILKAKEKQCSFVTLGSLLHEEENIGRAEIIREVIPGRDGEISIQHPC
jgi:undecaprenyl phosphate-alpha-L-ara4FN deformylase